MHHGEHGKKSVQGGRTACAKAPRPEQAWLVPGTRGRGMWPQQAEGESVRGSEHGDLPWEGLWIFREAREGH